MSRYCSACGDKLESFPVMTEITEAGSTIRWNIQCLMYCDNQECKSCGIAVVLAEDERPKKRK